MRLTKFDIGIMISMAIIIIFMSFTFPAMGLTSQNATQATDIPEFNITTDRFSLSGEFPDKPGAPSKGELIYDESKFANGDNFIMLKGDFDNGYELNILDIAGDGTIKFTEYSSSSVVGTDEYVVNGTGDGITHQNNSYIVEVIVTEWNGSTDFTAEYEIIQQPSGAGFLGRLPIVGGIFDATAELASIVGWIGTIFWFIAILIVEILLNVAITVFDSAVYFISLFGWLVSTYTGIVGGAPSGYISVVILIPGIALFSVFAKISIMLVSSVR